jgi:hypothetical protein
MSLRASVAVLLSALTLAGCAGAQRREATLARMYDYVYPRPLEEVWPQVEKFVQDEGFAIRKGEEQTLLISEWRTSFGESRVASGSERILVEGVSLNPANSEVRIYRESLMRGNRGPMEARENHGGSQLLMLAPDDDNPLEYDPVGLGHRFGVERDTHLKPPKNLNRMVERDVKMELRLLQRLAPQEVEQLERKAEEK